MRGRGGGKPVGLSGEAPCSRRSYPGLQQSATYPLSSAIDKAAAQDICPGLPYIPKRLSMGLNRHLCRSPKTCSWREWIWPASLISRGRRPGPGC